MALLFDRKCQVIVFDRKDNNVTPIKIEGLRIAFDLTFVFGKTKNSGKVMIYNLSESSRLRFESIVNPAVILKAGYVEEFGEIANFDINRIWSEKQGVDYVTTFDCYDGLKALKEVRISKSFSANVNLKEMGEHLLGEFKKAGAAIIHDGLDFFSGKSKNGYSLFGMGENLLGDILKRTNAGFQITNNKLELYYEEKGINTIIPVLRSDSGLIGSVVRKKKGVEFKALILPGKYYPMRKVRIESSNYSGEILLKKVQYQGDTHSQSWYVIGATSDK